MTRIAVTGLSGVIGTLLLPHLPPQAEIIELYHDEPILPPSRGLGVRVDLSSPSSFKKILKTLEIDVFIHLAAATHIDRCELDRVNGKKGDVWKINVEATRVIADYCRQHQARMIMLSTECVFDGKQSYYNELAIPSPKNWYGQTKATAELHVGSLGELGTVIRAAIAYHPDDNEKTMFGKIRQLFLEGKPFSIVGDQYVTYTFTPDIIRTILVVLNKKLSGIIHVSTNQELTPFEFSQTMAHHLGFQPQLARSVSIIEYFGEEKAKLRLRHASLDGKISQKKIGFKPHTLPEVLA